MATAANSNSTPTANSKPPKNPRKLVQILTAAIPIAALISVLNVTVSLSTSHWLDSSERIPISNSSLNDEYMIKRTISGLWWLCSFNLTEQQLKDGITTVPPSMVHCSKIDYFVKDRYTSDNNDSTNAIRFAATKAGPLFILASIFLTIALISSLFGYQRHRRLALFIAGISFIISGLILMIALVVYISALQAEVGPKLRPRNSVEQAQFVYGYGYSYVLIVVGFMATEMTGVMAVVYYLKWHQMDWGEKLQQDKGEGGIGGRSGGRSSHHNQNAKGYKIMDKHHHPAYNYGTDLTFDIPFPPPPPPPVVLPRDFTTLTTCGDDEFASGGGIGAGAGFGSLGRNKNMTSV